MRYVGKARSQETTGYRMGVRRCKTKTDAPTFLFEGSVAGIAHADLFEPQIAFDCQK